MTHLVCASFVFLAQSSFGHVEVVSRGLCYNSQAFYQRQKEHWLSSYEYWASWELYWAEWLISVDRSALQPRHFLSHHPPHVVCPDLLPFQSITDQLIDQRRPGTHSINSDILPRNWVCHCTVLQGACAVTVRTAHVHSLRTPAEHATSIQPKFLMQVRDYV